jgi:hypothetical protein
MATLRHMGDEDLKALGIHMVLLNIPFINE